MPTPTAFNGLTVNGSSDYFVVLQAADESAPFTLALTERQRLGQSPVVDARTMSGRDMPFHVFLKAGASITAAQFYANVPRYFGTDGGARTLVATLADGTTSVQINADVTSLDEGMGFEFHGVFHVTEAAWRSTTTNTGGTSPLTVGGTYKALPVITITPSTSTLNRRRVTITDNTGYGLSAYLVQATFDSTGVSAAANSDYVVFFQGRSIPFYVNTPNNASTKIYFRVDVDPAGSAFVDIYYGSTINNTVTNDKLDKAGMALTSATFSNTQWEWDLPFTISTNPRGAAGAWVAAKLGLQASGSHYGIAAEAGAAATIQLSPTVPLPDDIDGITVVIPAGAGTSNALVNLSRQDTTPSGATLYVKYRVAGSFKWLTAETKTAAGAVTTALDIDGAVQIAVYVECATAVAAAVEWKVAAAGNLTLTLDSSKTPTVSVGSAVTARYLNSALTNTTTGDVITITDAYLDDVAITITVMQKTITVASGPFYGSITFSEPDSWMQLPVGSNAWTNPSNASASFSWPDRFVE